MSLNDRLLRRLCLLATLCISMFVAGCTSTGAPEGHGSVADEILTPAATTSHAPSISDRLARIALDMVGAPYLFGRNSPEGFDCSGLVRYGYARTGVVVPRTSRAQRKGARKVKPSSIRPGDLLFFETSWKSGHVGIYVGNGKFVHAPSSGKHVTVSPLTEGYFASRLETAGRLH